MAYYDKYGVEFSDDHKALVKCPKDFQGEYVIPNSVISIGKRAFSYCSGLTSVVIPDSVTSIGDEAFRNCSGLTTVIIPNSVTSIGYDAFYGCSGLTEVTIPESVTSIGDDAFKCSGLTTVIIPNSVTSIGDGAFRCCYALTSVTIPNSVTRIGDWTFDDCLGLTNVTIPKSVRSIGDHAFCNVPNIVYNGTATGSPWGARSMNGYVDGWLVYKDASKKELLACSSAATGEIIIPNSVTSIGEWAFSDCRGLTSVTIPKSVRSIGDYAFASVPNLVYNGTSTGSPWGWGARSVNGYVEGWLVYKDASKKELLACSSAATGEIIIPNSVTSIGDYAFFGCRGLTSVTIGNSVASIGKEAFNNCYSLTSVTIGNRVTSIGDKAFTDCSKFIMQIVRSYRQELNERISMQKEKEELERRQREEREREETRRIAEDKERQRILREREAEEQRRIQEQQMQELLQDSILFFDTETTGVPRLYNAPVTNSANWPRLVQIAWLMADKNGNILKLKSVVIKPDGYTIPQDATAVHGISTERAQREGQPLDAVLEEFMDDVHLAANVVGHNIDFDMHIVGAELYRLDKDYGLLMDKPCTCTMKSSTDFCAIPNPNSYYGGYKWPSLQELYRKLFNSDFADAHDALADITATKECFFELKHRGIV